MKFSFAADSEMQPKTTRSHWLVVVFLLLIGVGLRLYRFPSVPFGLQQDEVSEAYESFSLLRTGADRWGVHLPVYFIGWGSGQNTLQAYLSMAAVRTLGLTSTSARLAVLISGLLSLPLGYAVARRAYGERVALTFLCLLAISPWHVMLSRWAVECNMVPFLLLLGMWLLQRAGDSGQALWILPSLVPFAAVLYCYGLMIVVIPPLLVLLAPMLSRYFRRRPKLWAGAYVVALLVVFPFGLFLIKNYLWKHDLPLEQYLPFSVPRLPVSRLSEVGSRLHSLRGSAKLFQHGLQDFEPWDQVSTVGPLPYIVLVFSVIGLVGMIREVVRTRKFDELVFPWLLASLPVCLVVPAKISESISIFLPLLLLAAIGVQSLWQRSGPGYLKILAITAAAFCLLYSTARFVRNYFGPEYARDSARTFRGDFPEALTLARSMAAPSEPIYVTENILLNYTYVLFYEPTAPERFQTSGATWAKPAFGRYVFRRENLHSIQGRFVFVLAPNSSTGRLDEPPCFAPTSLRPIGAMQVGECAAGARPDLAPTPQVASTLSGPDPIP